MNETITVMANHQPIEEPEPALFVGGDGSGIVTAGYDLSGYEEPKAPARALVVMTLERGNSKHQAEVLERFYLN